MEKKISKSEITLSQLRRLIDELGFSVTCARLETVLTRYPQPHGRKLDKAVEMVYHFLYDEEQ